MRLDPKKVEFIKPFLADFRRGQPPRFVGKEKNIHLRETAFVIEGHLLKVSFLGIEWFFQRAVTELSSLTIPYQRMSTVRLIRWTLARLLAGLLLLVLPILCVVVYVLIPMTSASKDFLTVTYLSSGLGWLLCIYLVLRMRAKYHILYRDRADRPQRLIMRFTSKPMLLEFDRVLQQYVAGAKQYSWPPAAT